MKSRSVEPFPLLCFTRRRVARRHRLKISFVSRASPLLFAMALKVSLEGVSRRWCLTVTIVCYPVFGAAVSGGELPLSTYVTVCAAWETEGGMHWRFGRVAAMEHTAANDVIEVENRFETHAARRLGRHRLNRCVVGASTFFICKAQGRESFHLLGSDDTTLCVITVFGCPS